MREKLALGCVVFMFMLFGTVGTSLVFAGDHLSSSNSCTPCHGTNVRQVHDYEETIPLDCNICHAVGGTTWYLNATCAGYLDEGGVEVEEVKLGEWQIVYDPYFDFNFACKACHVAENPEHQQ